MQRTAVLFVCLGNICRSPMAEVVAATLAARAGRATGLHVESCGTASFNVGKPADPRALGALRAAGYPPPAHVARTFREDDFLRFDRIVAMDRSNLRTLEAWRPPLPRATLALLPGAGGPMEIEDPFYAGEEAFAATLGRIEQGVRRLLAELDVPC